MLLYKVKGSVNGRVRGVRRFGGERRIRDRRIGIVDTAYQGIENRLALRRVRTRRLSIDRRHMERAIFVPIAKDSSAQNLSPLNRPPDGNKI